MPQIDLVDIIVRPEYFNRDRIRSHGLVASIRDQGMLVPVFVRDLENGTYELLDGRLRYNAAKELGWTQINCLASVISDENVAAWLEVKCKPDSKMTGYEIAKHLGLLIKQYGAEYLADKLGKPTEYILDKVKWTKGDKFTIDYVAISVTGVVNMSFTGTEDQFNAYWILMERQGWEFEDIKKTRVK